jgi:hypothetical protein
MPMPCPRIQLVVASTDVRGVRRARPVAQVVVYRVTPYDGPDDDGKAKPADATRDDKGLPNMPPERPLIGRDTEMSFVLNRAANMIAGMATGGAIVIEGNTGGRPLLCTHHACWLLQCRLSLTALAAWRGAWVASAA